MCVEKRGLKYVWDHFEETIAAVIILIMAIINFMNVVGRFVLQHSLAWADELTLLLFLWATMMGAATLLSGEVTSTWACSRNLAGKRGTLCWPRQS